MLSKLFWLSLLSRYVGNSVIDKSQDGVCVWRTREQGGTRREEKDEACSWPTSLLPRTNRQYTSITSRHSSLHSYPLLISFRLLPLKVRLSPVGLHITSMLRHFDHPESRSKRSLLRLERPNCRCAERTSRLPSCQLDSSLHSGALGDWSLNDPGRLLATD